MLPRLGVRGLDPGDHRVLRAAVGTVGGVGGPRDIDLVGDRHRHHVAIGTEGVNHPADVAGPRRDVTRLASRRVIADLELDLEARARITRHRLLKGVDPGLTVRPEQAVETHHELVAGRRQRLDRGEVLGRVVGG
ncbi:MAG: hypothetical protein ACRDNK_01865 [Solirubrobacteraceae bacterium]